MQKSCLKESCEDERIETIKFMWQSLSIYFQLDGNFVSNERVYTANGGKGRRIAKLEYMEDQWI